MKPLLFLLLFIPATLQAQLFVHLNTSVRGYIGAEYQVKNISVSSSWRRDKVYSTGWFNSYCFSVNYYIPKSLIYVSGGYATKGKVQYENYQDCTPMPSVIVLAGLRFPMYELSEKFSKRLFLDFGAGINASRKKADMAFECSINYKIVR